MRTHNPKTGDNTTLGPAIIAIENDTSDVTFLDDGNMGVPCDPKLFLPNNVRFLTLSFISFNTYAANF
jgi:hypothetical protein